MKVNDDLKDIIEHMNNRDDIYKTETLFNYFTKLLELSDKDTLTKMILKLLEEEIKP